MAHEELYADVRASVAGSRDAPLQATVVLLSGCEDHQLSRDGRTNGAFTGALLSTLADPNPPQTFRDLVEAAAAKIPPDYEQHPVYSVYSFGETSAFAP
jgi:hypothetical protein